jgi:hypothetical protein
MYGHVSGDLLMLVKALRVSCVLELILCGMTYRQLLGDDQEEVEWIALPAPGRLCIMPAAYQLPYTQRGMQERIRDKRHLFRENSQFGVYLRKDQVLGLSGEGSGGLEFLEDVPSGQLRALRLETAAITDEGITRLRRYDELRQLCLMIDRVDNMARVVNATPCLQYFSVFSPLNLDPATATDEHYFSDEQFKIFAGTPEVRCIHVSSRLLSDEAIRLAVKIPKLEVLGILGTRKITDDGFAALTNAKQLKEVVLEAGPRCTDDGVKQLLRLEHLEWIEICGMTKIDDATVAALKARFPAAQIEFKQLVKP